MWLDGVILHVVVGDVKLDVGVLGVCWVGVDVYLTMGCGFHSIGFFVFVFRKVQDGFVGD